jgi:glycosyltransferase involved in cell wall biosynthesis
VAPEKHRVGIVASHPIQYQSPLWRALAAKGLDVEVLYLSKHGLRASMDADFGRAVQWDSDLFSGFKYRFLGAPLDPSPGSMLTGWSGTVVPAILMGGYQAILVPGYTSTGYLAARVAAAVLGVPVYIRAETVSSRTKVAAGVKGWRIRARSVVLRPLLGSYTGAFPIGWDSKDFYRENGMDAARLTHAPYGVENKWFARPPDAAIRASRERLGCRTGDVVVLHAGKLIERKRPEQAVILAASLRARGVPARAVIVGSGPIEQRIRESMHGDDVFVGFANQSELPVLYASADVVVVASTYETWGLVVNEALAAGAPVLSSPHAPAAVEMAALSSAVRILPSMDPDAWADACLGLIGPGREACAAQAMSVVARYDVDVAATAIAARLMQDLR